MVTLENWGLLVAVERVAVVCVFKSERSGNDGGKSTWQRPARVARPKPHYWRRA